MPKPEFRNYQNYTFTDLHSPANEEIKELLIYFQHSHNIFNKFMNVEICALAETMDRFLPGFWNRFLENRHQSLKEFLEYKQNLKSSLPNVCDNMTNPIEPERLN